MVLTTFSYLRVVPELHYVVQNMSHDVGRLDKRGRAHTSSSIVMSKDVSSVMIRLKLLTWDAAESDSFTLRLNSCFIKISFIDLLCFSYGFYSLSHKPNAVFFAVMLK